MALYRTPLRLSGINSSDIVIFNNIWAVDKNANLSGTSNDYEILVWIFHLHHENLTADRVFFHKFRDKSSLDDDDDYEIRKTRYYRDRYKRCQRCKAKIPDNIIETIRVLFI